MEWKIGDRALVLPHNTIDDKKSFYSGARGTVKQIDEFVPWVLMEFDLEHSFGDGNDNLWIHANNIIHIS